VDDDACQGAHHSVCLDDIQRNTGQAFRERNAHALYDPETATLVAYEFNILVVF